MVAPVITIGIVGVLFGILQFLAARRGGSLLENFGAGGWVIAFEVVFAAGVFSAPPRHEWDHPLVVTEGRGVALIGGKKLVLRPGVVLLVQSNEEHQFLQRGKEPLKFLTVTPI